MAGNRSNPSSSKTPVAGFQISNNFQSPSTIQFAFLPPTPPAKRTFKIMRC
jgi:hypothetical protein